MSVLAFTPLAWVATGRQSETYPELIYFGLGLPMALIAIVAGASLAWFGSKAKSGSWPFRALSLTAATANAICALLALMLVPRLPLGTGFLSAVFYLALPVLVVALFVAGVSAFSRARRRQT
jgi:purine-cytosine permease-like protein